jgi:hypothetical protein
VVITKENRGLRSHLAAETVFSPFLRCENRGNLKNRERSANSSGRLTGNRYLASS